jgi:hypothetical protein
VLWQSTFINNINKWSKKPSQAAGFEYPRFSICIQLYQTRHWTLLPAVPFCVDTEQLVIFRSKKSTFDITGGTADSEKPVVYHDYSAPLGDTLSCIQHIWSSFDLTHTLRHFRQTV